MTLPYLLRLVCLLLAAFYLVHAALALPLAALAPRLARRQATMVPARAARCVFWLRLLPWCAATFFTLTVCLPCYVRWEPAAAGERVGAWFLICAALGAAALAISLIRAFRAARELRLLARSCDAGDRRNERLAAGLAQVVLEAEEQFVILAGLWRRRLIVSSATLRGLNAAQWEAARAHELAHAAAHDNWKRWLWLVAPDLLPGCAAFASLEACWRRWREWAADDAATAGDPLRALALAEALLRVGRAAARPPALLASALAADSEDLAYRVSRLLGLEKNIPAPRRPGWRWAGFAVAGLLAASLGLLLVCVPAAPHVTYRLLEVFVR